MAKSHVENRGKAVINKHQRGFTLVELLISMTIGMAVTAAITNVLVSSNSMNLDTLRTVRFNQELRSVMSLMVSDLRRARYNGRAVSLIGQGATQTSPFVGIADCNGGVPTAASCISYSYDDNGNGIVEAAEQYGFQLNANGEVGRLGAGGALTSAADLTVTALSFTVTDNEVCETPSSGVHIQSVTIVLTASSPNVTGLTRTLTETVRTRNSQPQFHAAADCVNT